MTRAEERLARKAALELKYHTDAQSIFQDKASTSSRWNARQSAAQ